MIAELRARAWMIGCLFCLALLCMQTVRIEGLKIWPLNIHGLKAELKDAQDKLNAISSKRNEQKVVTRDRIITVEKQIRHADDQAKVIEQAKLPGQCRTPPEIMGADL